MPVVDHRQCSTARPAVCCKNLVLCTRTGDELTSHMTIATAIKAAGSSLISTDSAPPPQVLLIRPKLHLANDGNYRETRYFATWKHPRTLEQHGLGRGLQAACGQKTCPFGDGVVVFNDTVSPAECPDIASPKMACCSCRLRQACFIVHIMTSSLLCDMTCALPGILQACMMWTQPPPPHGAPAPSSPRQGFCPPQVLAAETCEELFTPLAPHIGLALAGVEIISNGSGSHHQLRKLDLRQGACARLVVGCSRNLNLHNAHPNSLLSTLVPSLVVVVFMVSMLCRL